MKKKLPLMLCLCFMVLAMAACGTDPKTVDYFGASYSELEATMGNEVSALVNMTEENRMGVETQGTELIKKLLASWDETTADLGEYKELGEFSLTKTQDTVTAEQIVKFENRDAVVSYVYTYDYGTKQIMLTDASADKVYSLGEKMEKAGLNTLMGMGTVFVVLILISLIIYCFNIIPYLQKKKDGQKAQAVKQESAVVTQIEKREEKQLTDDLELVAVISAAIAASTGASAEGFIVRSIHRR